MSKERLSIGIQGGPGSFNEEALHDYTQKHTLKNYDVRYMHTTEDVLNALHTDNPTKKIDQGIFALHNAAGGIVDESVEAMGKYNFESIDKIRIKISHTLMVGKGVDFNPQKITLVTHPQVLAQCENNLERKYPDLPKTSGDGPMIDHALVAEYMAQEKPVTAGGIVFDARTIATMGSRRLAEIHDLTVIDKDLQDLGDQNYTSFLVVQKA